MPCRWTRSRNNRGSRAALFVLAVGLGVTSGLPAILPIGSWAAARPAQAAESEAVSKAREHYKNGEKAFKAGKFDEALREWDTGYRLSNRPLFLLNMGHAERRRGQLANARTLYKRFLLMEPETKLRGEIEGVLREIDSALAADDAGKSGTAATAPAAQTGPAGDPITPTPEGSPPGPAALAAQITAHDSNLAITQSSAAAPAPVWRRWWFWAGAGTVVAAVVVTTLLVRRDDPYTKTGSLGSLGNPP